MEQRLDSDWDIEVYRKVLDGEVVEVRISSELGARMYKAPGYHDAGQDLYQEILVEDEESLKRAPDYLKYEELPPRVQDIFDETTYHDWSVEG